MPTYWKPVHDADLRVGRDLGAIHLPNRNAAGRAVEQQQIGLAVAVEVTSVGEVPAGRRIDGTDLWVGHDLGAVHLPDRNTIGG